MNLREGRERKKWTETGRRVGEDGGEERKKKEVREGR